eukprot:1181631-Prorocentrum_minimum.AAC.2
MLVVIKQISRPRVVLAGATASVKIGRLGTPSCAYLELVFRAWLCGASLRFALGLVGPILRSCGIDCLRVGQGFVHRGGPKGAQAGDWSRRVVGCDDCVTPASPCGERPRSGPVKGDPRREHGVQIHLVELVRPLVLLDAVVVPPRPLRPLREPLRALTAGGAGRPVVACGKVQNPPGLVEGGGGGSGPRDGGALRARGSLPRDLPRGGLPRAGLRGLRARHAAQARGGGGLGGLGPGLGVRGGGPARGRRECGAHRGSAARAGRKHNGDSRLAVMSNPTLVYDHLLGHGGETRSVAVQAVGF